MNSSISRKLARAGAAIALVLAGAIGSGAALAAATPAGTIVSNLATMAYKVGGVDQPDIGSSPTGNTAGAGTATTFVVDNKIDLLVQNTDGGFVNVAPGAGVATGSAQTLTFTVTNNGNYTQGYKLTPINETGVTFLTATDSFDGGSCTASTATVTPANPSYISALAPGQSTTVFVVCTIPASQANGTIAVIALKAETTDVGTQNLASGTGTTIVNGTTTYNVFADPQGTDDSAKDGAHSARGAFRIFTSVLSVSKVASAMCDPINGTTSPKNIPGAIVEYTVTISNTGSASASLTQITDTLQTSYVTLNETYLPAANVTSASLCVAGASNGNAFKFSYSAIPSPTYNGPAVTPRTSPTQAGTTGSYSAPNITLPLSTLLAAETGHLAGELLAGEAMVVKYQVVIK